MNKLLLKVSFGKNLGKYILLGIIYILLFVCIMSVMTFKQAANASIEKMLISNSYNNHFFVRSNTTERFFDAKISDHISECNIESLTEICSLPGKIGVQTVTVIGMDFEKIGNIGIQTKSASLENAKSHSLIISESLALQNNWKLNDILTVKNFDGYEINLTITGICVNSSFFANNQNPVIISIDAAETLSCKKNKITGIYIKLTDLSDMDSSYLEIGKAVEGSDLTLIKLIDKTQYAFYVEPTTVVLTIFSVITGVLAVILSYYTFKKIIEDRMFNYGTLLSLGLTKKRLNLFLMFEVVVFTALVSIIGTCLSVLFISVLMSAFIGSSSITFNIVYPIILFAIIFIFTFALVLFIANKNFKRGTISLIKKMPYNALSEKENRRKKLLFVSFFIFALVLIGIGIGLLIFIDKFSQIIGLITFIFGSLILTYYVLIIATKGLRRLTTNFFPRAVSMICKAENSILKNKGTILSIFILTILISIVGIAKPIISNSLNAFYKDIDIISFVQGDRYTKESILSLDDNILNVFKSYMAKQTVKGKSISILGVDIADYQAYSQDRFDGPLTNLLDPQKREVLVSSTFSSDKKLKVGDNIILKTTSGEMEYKIVGTYDTYENQGNNLIVSEEIFLIDFIPESTQFLISVVNKENINDTISLISENEEFKNRLTLIKTEDMVNANISEINTILTIVNLLVIVLCVLTAICWIINLYMNIASDLECFAIEITLGKTHNFIALELSFIYFCIIGLSVSVIAAIFAGVSNYYVVNILSSTIGKFDYFYTVSGFAIIFVIVIIAMSIILPITNFLRKKFIKVI